MDYVLYHANCYDGFGAAYAAWKALGNDAIYKAMYYGDALPSFPDGSTVYMVDYSRKRDEIETLMEYCDVRIIDHHKSAEQELVGLPGVVFDLTKSGAYLTWEHFHPGQEIPKMIRHISDRDLWQFKLEGTKEVHAALCSYPFDFKIWDAFTVEGLIEEGKTLLRYHNVLTDRLCENIQFKEIGGHKVPIVNTCLLFSEVPSRLIELYPDYPFSAYYYDRKDGVRQYGLRSRNDFDVSEVAKQYGGGGHKNAAGFEVKG